MNSEQLDCYGMAMLSPLWSSECLSSNAQSIYFCLKFGAATNLSPCLLLSCLAFTACTARSNTGGFAHALRNFNRVHGSNAGGQGGTGVSISRNSGDFGLSGLGGAGLSLDLDHLGSAGVGGIPAGMSPTAQQLHRVSKDFKDGLISAEEKESRKNEILSNQAGK